MASISSVTLPDNNQYDLKDKRVPDNAVFTDTTYSFESSTNGFRVTPSSGSSYEVSISSSSDGNASWTINFGDSDSTTIAGQTIQEMRDAYLADKEIYVRAESVTLEDDGIVGATFVFHMIPDGTSSVSNVIGTAIDSNLFPTVTFLNLTITPSALSSANGTAVVTITQDKDTTALGSMTGTLGAYHGGTGQTSLNASANALINGLGTGTNTPRDADYYVSQYVGGGTTTTTYHRRPMSALWTYVKGKIDADGSYTNVWEKNTVDTAGYVSAPTANKTYHFWATNENGEPGWRQGVTVAYNHVGLATPGFYRNLYNLLETDGSNNTANANCVWKCNANGVPGWRADANTWTAMAGATADAAGTAGYVPAPAAGKQSSYLRGDGTWQAPQNNLTTTTAYLPLDARQGKALGDRLSTVEGNKHYTHSIMSTSTGWTIRSISWNITDITNGLAVYDASEYFDSIAWAIAFVSNTSSAFTITATTWSTSALTVTSRIHKRSAMTTNETLTGQSIGARLLICGGTK